MAAGSAGAKRSSGSLLGAAIGLDGRDSVPGTCGRSEGSLAIAAALAMIAPAILNFAWIAFDGGGRSLQDLVGRVRVVRTN